jgi:uncharacterized membrane protein YraQ (UPF0718 family)
VSFGLLLLVALYVAAASVVLARGDGSFRVALRRTMEQLMLLGPRMLCALVAAGFLAKLIPTEFIARYLGEGAGIGAILVAVLTGMIIPAGPVIAFSVAAVFLRAGASTPALIAFITSWSIFATHRIFIYELPMLGPTFLRMRLVAVSTLPVIAGLIGICFFWLAAAMAGGT